MEHYRFLKKYTRKKVDKNFDSIYESIKQIAMSEYGYDDTIKIVSDTKWVKFYIPLILPDIDED